MGKQSPDKGQRAYANSPNVPPRARGRQWLLAASRIAPPLEGRSHGLTLGELRRAPGLAEAVLLALDHARVTGQQPVLTQGVLELRVVQL